MNLQESPNYLSSKLFSYVYVEEQISQHPNTQLILSRLPQATVLPIKHYKEVFNRPHQNFPVQKQSQQIILARKTEDFLYEAPVYAQNNGHSHFYYNTVVLNCLYNCGYCYLQGMFPSANFVVFVNQEDFWAHTKQKLAQHPLALALSYDTDLLATENLIPFCRQWIEFAHTEPNLSLEIRTKSANFKTLAQISPVPNVLLAWTLSPEPIAQNYEWGAPSLQLRIKNLKAALEQGWKVRLCLDPILQVPHWQEYYTQFLAQLANQIPWSQIHDVTLGVFRMNRDYLKKITRERDDVDILFHPAFNNTHNNSNSKEVSYTHEETQQMLSFLKQKLSALISSEKIITL